MTRTNHTLTYRRHLLVGLAAGLLLLRAIPADARPPLLPTLGDYEVRLENGAGVALETFRHRGQDLVLGRYGDRYAIRIVNRSGRRVEAVVSVDGRDAITGRPGNYVGQRGYLVGPYETISITGFRKSLDEVATFRFTSPGDSYSSRMGTPENVGVIGVAFFPERTPRRQDPIPMARRDGGAPKHKANPNPRAGRAADGSTRAGSARGAPRGEERARTGEPRRPAPAESSARGSGRKASPNPPSADAYEREYGYGPQKDNLGTEYGEARESRVLEVSFERANRSRPVSVVTLRYDDESGLEARGIRVHPRRERPSWRRDEPVAFPDSRFAPPPPGYDD
jgi:hypothetical protein